MTRLDSELQRLFLPLPGPSLGEAGASPDSEENTRALVLAVTRPAPWVGLGRVWRGVQAELDLPAPAIAVTGEDACALWFPLAQAIPRRQAEAFLRALQQRYLSDFPPQRVRLDPVSPGIGAEGPILPPCEVVPGHWSAFVAPDLAALFDDEPWLDLQPPADAQAELLSRVQCIRAADWQQALATLGVDTAAPAIPGASAAAALSIRGPEQDPRRFLLSVMNDPAVDLRLRIEAAKALLPGAGGPTG